MIYRLLADFVLIIHLCFVLFAVFGGLLVLRPALDRFSASSGINLGISRAVFHLDLPAHTA